MRKFWGVEGNKEGAGSPRPASTRFIEPKQHLPLVLWRALEALELCSVHCLKDVFSVGLFVHSFVYGETFKNCSQTVSSLNCLVPQFSISHYRAHKVHQKMI